MDRSRVRLSSFNRIASLLAVCSLLVSNAGCPALLSTGIYVLQGGNMVPPDCDALKGQRVVVMCRPPATNEFRHAGASRAISQRVSELLVKNVKGIDVVNPREVDEWVDESDWGDFRELAEAVRADLVVHIEMDDFDLYKGKTLYQGRAAVTINVYDIRENSKNVYTNEIGEVLYPVNSGIPAQDKPPQQFEREFVEIIADRVAVNFYKHDPHDSFAMDARANR